MQLLDIFLLSASHPPLAVCGTRIMCLPHTNPLPPKRSHRLSKRTACCVWGQLLKFSFETRSSNKALAVP